MFLYKFEHTNLETVSQQNKVILRSDSNSLNPQFTEYLFSEFRNSRLGKGVTDLWLDGGKEQFYFEEDENTSELGAKQ